MASSLRERIIVVSLRAIVEGVERTVHDAVAVLEVKPDNAIIYMVLVDICVNLIHPRNSTSRRVLPRSGNSFRVHRTMASARLLIHTLVLANTPGALFTSST